MELSDLISRVEGATEGSRELDALIAVAVDGFFIDGADPRGRPKYCCLDSDGGQVSPGQAHDMLVHHYTTSLDAALALTERVLGPDAWFAVERQNEPGGAGKYFGSVAEAGHTFHDKGYWPPIAYAPTPALALVLATLRALEQKGETK